MREALESLRKTIAAAAPDATEAISYQIREIDAKHR
jgi:uncharacterized protein YdhG (YjbR/CyaY superfamily)